VARATTREELDAAVAALLPHGWYLDERGDAVPGELDDGEVEGGVGSGGRGRGRRADWTPKIGGVGCEPNQDPQDCFIDSTQNDKFHVCAQLQLTTASWPVIC
jgi:hypothetical protein